MAIGLAGAGKSNDVVLAVVLPPRLEHAETSAHSLLDGAAVEEVRKVIWGVAKDMDIKLHALSVQPDHVHVAFSAPPRLSVAEIAQRFKGGSSFRLSKQDDLEWVGWQAEYGVVEFGHQSL